MHIQPYVIEGKVCTALQLQFCVDARIQRRHGHSNSTLAVDAAKLLSFRYGSDTCSGAQSDHCHGHGHELARARRSDCSRTSSGTKMTSSLIRLHSVASLGMEELALCVHTTQTSTHACNFSEAACMHMYLCSSCMWLDTETLTNHFSIRSCAENHP